MHSNAQDNLYTEGNTLHVHSVVTIIAQLGNPRFGMVL
jgi:hypothetical protein